MAFKKYGGKRSGKAGGKKSRSYTKRVVRGKKVRGGIKKTIKRVLESAAEKKLVNFEDTAMSVCNFQSSDWITNNIFNLLPHSGGPSPVALAQITQGVDQGQRVGNRIRTHSVMLKMILRSNAFYDSVSNYNPRPMYIGIWIFKLKPHLNDTSNDVDTVCRNSFFQDGNASQAFSGLQFDLTKTVNSNMVTLLKRKVVKLGMAQYVSAFGINSANNSQQQFANNDFKMSIMAKLNVTKYVPKSMIFNDGTNTPVVRKTWMIFVPFAADGTAYTTAAGIETGPIPARLDFGWQYTYTDL